MSVIDRDTPPTPGTRNQSGSIWRRLATDVVRVWLPYGLLIIILILSSCRIGAWALGQISCVATDPVEALSPDGAYKAVVYERNCGGATTNFATHVLITRATNAFPNKRGNVFVTEGHPEYTRVEATWISDRTLLISYEQDSVYGEPYDQEYEFRDYRTRIDIEYEDVDLDEDDEVQEE